MRIMVLNNNVIYENEKGLFIYKETGKFLLELKDAENEVIVFQFRMKFKGVDFLADYNISNRGLDVVAVKRKESDILAYVKAFIVGFKTILRSDFVYLFYPGHICTVFAFLCLISGKRFGFYIRGEKGILSRVAQYLYKKAEIILTISPSYTQILKSTGTRVSTIRPMMEISESDIVLDKHYQKKLHYELLYVGRIERPKGLYELFDAVHRLVRSGIKNFTLNLIGDGPDAEVLKKLMKEHSLEKYVIFHGTITDFEKLTSYYKQADIFILPSYHEGFPRVLYEAMIFGVPIITTFVGSISYLMKDNENCAKIEPKDSGSLLNKLTDFINNFEERSVLAKNATQTIINYFSDKKSSHAQQLLDFIKLK